MTSHEHDYDLVNAKEITKDWDNNPAAFLPRYYTMYHHQQDPIYVRQSPSKVCVVGLLPNHAILEDASSKSEIKVTQKVACGAKVQPNTVICELMAGDQVYPIKAAMHGKLLEVNPRISELLYTRPLDNGFIAVIMSRWEDPETQLKDFIKQ
ncbi:hypothetical protein EC973_001605 [Apophysomyces ossiformis]|uniref:Protein Abitram n=1 Tax=Apophysomyces ossiformis TaxID=679940 RepID=A0A8H7BYE5_9FUNG|nr:hypothetical protein EC973_001605 [Apophysomyces ossiformis]